ncbi:MAG: hypothetical protein KJ011_01700 [Burkholderiaceae bacterium]|nr:hypothetical protein [Burkholderiaceae bacterium]
MDTMHAHDVAVDAQEVFSLPGLLDQSAALAAAQRLYAQNRAGLRFFCENRRVVSVDEAQAMEVDAEEGRGTPTEAQSAPEEALHD